MTDACGIRVGAGGRSRATRRALGVGVVLLLGAAPARADEHLLHRLGAYAGGRIPGGAAAQAAAAAEASLRAQAAARGDASLDRAMNAIRRFQAQQDAARAAALAGSGAGSKVKDGLGVGGLQIVDGARHGADCLSSQWCGAGMPTETVENGRHEVTIQQQQSKAILTWSGFNVGPQTDLHFDQSAGGANAGSWVALNRVLDPSGVPSQILGSIRAEGQVYIINRNGILFGGSSQVDVGSLLASTWDLPATASDPALAMQQRNQLFLNGILSSGGGSVTLARDASADATTRPAIEVDAGANIHIGNRGQALLVGLDVKNAGSIVAPDGQVLLAAAARVTLQKGVDSRGYQQSPSDLVSGGGVAENSGVISTPRGNITLVGGEVRQDGLASATTAADANGSIDIGNFGAKVLFGAGSFTQVLPDDNGKKVIGYSTPPSSRIGVQGDDIYLAGGSTLYAPSGTITLGKVESSPTGWDNVDSVRVYVDSGARIDVSGLREIEVPMEQNTITARLGANELRDNPVVAGGALRGKRADFDARLGVKGVADLSGYYNLMERDLRQLMTAGGTVQLYGREIITREGSVIDLSGGSLRYRDGYVTSTVLADPTGRLVRIENAVAGVPYTLAGEFSVDHPRWGITQTYSAPLLRSSPRFEEGYLQGASAGTLVLDGNGTGLATNFEVPSPTGAFRILDGQIVTSTIVGPNQRDLPSSSTDLTSVWHSQPSGATLAINRAGDITIAKLAGPQLSSSFTHGSSPDPAREYQQILPASWFNGSGFTRVRINSGYSIDGTYDGNGAVVADTSRTNLAPGGHLTIEAGVTVDLGDGGSFSFSGKAVELDGTLRAAGGSVSLTALDLAQGLDRTSVNVGTNEGNWPGIHLGAGGAIDVAGRWTNDGLAGPRHALDGGSVSLVAMSLVLDRGSLVDVSGGGRGDASGSKVKAGNGGQIVLDVSRPFRPNTDTLPPQEGGSLTANGTLSGYALGTGGSLTLVLPNHVVIGDRLPGGGSGGDLLLGPDFFTRGGFSAFSIVGDQGITVTAGQGGHGALRPSTESLVLTASPAEIPSGARLDDFVVRTALPPDRMAPMKLSLSTSPTWSTHQPGHADLAIEEGAEIRMTPGSTVSLSSERTIWVDGLIESDGGAIVLDATKTSSANQFNPVGRILLGPDAALLVPGYVQTTYSGSIAQRTVRDGGSVSLAAALDVLMDPGAVIDASGLHATADFIAAAGGTPRMASGYAPVPVDGNAGSITIATQPSDQASVLAGRLRLMPGGASGRGGTLSIVLPKMVVAQTIPEGFSVEGPASAPRDSATLPSVSADRLDESGADNIVLGSGLGPSDSPPSNNGRAIVFSGQVDLHSRRSLTLSTPVLATVPGTNPAVTLSSEYVAFIGALNTGTNAAYSVENVGSLTVNAGLIDLVKSVWLGSPYPGFRGGTFAKATFVSSGDIRLADHDSSAGPGALSTLPGLFARGDLTFEAAQVYVASQQQDGGIRGLALATSSYLIHSDGSITIARPPGADPSVDPPLPLSFGGHLTLQAPTIVQGGVLRAPQGQIQLEGTDSVQLLPGSLTSTSLEGQSVPFGPTLIGGIFRGYDQAGDTPAKSITIKGNSVAIRSGAVVDVSGGGDLLGWTFVAGNGGSKDILSLPGSYAILPGYRSSAAPIGGAQGLVDTSLKVGDSVYLHGVPGLADGYYTLLPAHYALLPGGRLIQPGAGSYASDVGTYTAADGSVYASGFRAVAGTAIRDPGYTVFRVLDQDTFNKYSELVVYSFNDYAHRLAADAGVQVRVPYDAGSVVLDAAGSLDLSGSGRFGVGKGGLLGNLDISAPEIAVIGRGQALPNDGKHYLTIDPAVLSSFGAGSTFLGGTRQASNGSTEVHLTARDVFVSTGSDAALSGPEILLGATGSVTVADGSRIEAHGAAAGSLAPIVVRGDGALVRVSTGDRVSIRHDESSGVSGLVTIGSATVAASGTIALDATSTLTVASDVTLEAPRIDLASTEIDVGGGAGGTVLSKSLIQRLASSSDLLLRGYQSIHLASGLELGGRSAGAPTLAGLTLDTPLVQGEAGAAARITAGRLTLRNSGGASAGGPGTPGSGTLTLDVDELVLGAGDVRLTGYATVGGRAGLIRVGDSGSLDVDGNLVVASAGVRSAGGAAYSLRASGDIVLGRDPAAPPAEDPDALGAWLEIQAGRSLSIDTSVYLPAGTLIARSLAGALHVGSQARIDVRGRAVDFQDQVRFAPGGTIRLDSAGDLEIAGGATLDVSGSDRGGAAGTMWLSAAGQTSVRGALRGAAQPGFASGAFLLDTGTVDGGFSRLNLMLEAGGFRALREVRVRNPGHLAGQDLVLEAGQRITAHEVVLEADNDRVVVAGTIDASGDESAPEGGRIVLRGGGGVTVSGTLDAHAYAGALPGSAFAPAGGLVELLADGGRVDVTGSAVIDVTGVPGNPRGGRVVVRARRDGDDIAIDELAGTFRGARSVVLQGVESYSSALVDTPLVDRVIDEGAAWLALASARVLQRIDRRDLPLQVGAGAVIRSDGDLTIQDDVDLKGRLGPGYLGFVARGSIDVRARISDGFASADRDAALLARASSSYSFEAGADIKVQQDALIRTGTGDITLLAGRDLLLLPPSDGSVDSAPSIYTAGMAQPEAPSGMGLGAFPGGGGDIEIRAGRDISAPLPSQSTSAWLFRQGDTSWLGDAVLSTAKEQTSWSIAFSNFELSIGALGGGDVDIRAGRDVVRLQVAIPTTGYLTTAPGQVPRAGDLVVNGGGDLDLVAGRDIVGGLFMLGRGHAELRAGGRVRPSATDLVGLRPDPTTYVGLRDSTVGVLFGLSDASATVTAGSTVLVEGIYDPMTQGQVAENLIQRNGRSYGSGFWGYTDRAAFSATSLGGDVTYANDPWASTDLTLQFGTKEAYRVAMAGSAAGSENVMFARLPPRLLLTSLEGSVIIADRYRGNSSVNLAPSVAGTLELVARDDVSIRVLNLAMLNIDAPYRHGPLDAFAVDHGNFDSWTLKELPSPDTNANRGFQLPYADHTDPARLIAIDGSVTTCPPSVCAGGRPTQVNLPVALSIYAGTDVEYGRFIVQHNLPADLTTVVAGRDIRYLGLSIAGGGSVVEQAGRDYIVDKNSNGGGSLLALGNQEPKGGALASNLALDPKRAASVTILAGAAAGPDYDRFAASYLDPSNSAGVVRTYLPELATFMTDLDAARYGALSPSQLVVAFQQLPLARRQIFLNSVYFSELKETGIDYNAVGGPRYQSYDRGFRAIATLFPARGQGGNIILNAQPVETDARGDITMLAPYGRVQVGAESAPQSSDNGVVTRRGGDIRVMADGDISLLTSRVFTLEGGDITMWTSNGSITAGSGASTSVLYRPLQFTMSNDAVVTVDAFGLQTGAGIGVLDALQGSDATRRRSRLDLIAPRGEVNAGDAGIRVVGDINIAALVVVGVENIQVSGFSMGVPTAKVPNTVALTAAAQVTQAVAQEAASARAQSSARNVVDDLPSIITVEVVGYETEKKEAPGEQPPSKRPPARK